ncbi:class I SAM-dependent methyltransferase [Streptomyces sp. NPDC006990]|uniref:class I SAM-dependent DNA methyltransferase n=1 Tax=unclassified Streptomyces TaxID=2593676 RepID=UPI0034511742
MTTAPAWDTYARQRPDRRTVNASGARTWFNWTQYPDHGPGAELLGIGPGASVLDLGCGKGGNLAHVAGMGTRAIGVDLSERQLHAARNRWGADAFALHQGDALGYLAGRRAEFDSVYSVFGAAWFIDPAELLPAVRAALRPGGVFAFSHRPPVAGCYGCQASYIERGPDADPHVVRRWDHEPEQWRALLGEHGFLSPTARVIEAPPGPRTVGTLLVRALG